MGRYFLKGNSSVVWAMAFGEPPGVLFYYGNADFLGDYFGQPITGQQLTLGRWQPGYREAISLQRLGPHQLLAFVVCSLTAPISDSQSETKTSKAPLKNHIKFCILWKYV